MRDATLADYRWLYAHGYMPDGLKCADGIMSDIVKRCPASFLDFGCGRGHLVALINSAMQARCAGWDPAGHPCQKCPRAHAQYVISCDVLEHIAPQEIDATIAMLGTMASKGLLLTIANMNDVHHVNGEQVQLHLIREEMGWWLEKLRTHFPTATIKGRPITCNGDRFAITVDLP